MLGINVTYILKPGMRQAYLKALADHGIQKSVQEEEGCSQYDFFLPVDKEDELLLVEKWTDRAAQKVHMTQHHMKVALGFKNDYVADTKLELYEL